VVAGWGSSPGRVARKERRKGGRKEEKGPLGRNPFEFQKFENTKKEVEMTCSNGFYNWYKPTCKFSEFLSKCKKGFW
jgi:hypothetical protein